MSPTSVLYASVTHLWVPMFIVFLGIACSPLPRRAASPGPQEMWMVDAAWLETESGDEVYRLSGRELVPGDVYLVIGARNRTVWVTVSGAEAADCDHCLNPRFVARSDTRLHSVLGAIGPFLDVRAQPIAHSQAQRPTPEQRNETQWRVTLAVDVDGDGTVDFENVERCDHLVPSGCRDQVCDRFCSGTRVAGRHSVRGQRCRGFVADSDDCMDQAVQDGAE